MKKYESPNFILDGRAQGVYSDWLRKKAKSVRDRDAKRHGSVVSLADYKLAIHEAVQNSNGLDRYTGEGLDWSLISQYDGSAAKQGGLKYHRQYKLLPTIDHVEPGGKVMKFAVCGWRTNDAKGCMTHDEFVAFCNRVVEFSR